MEMFVLSYVNVLCIYPKLCLLFRLMAQNLLVKTVLYTIVLLIYVNETICMVICPSTRFKSIILWPRMNCLMPRLSQNTSVKSESEVAQSCLTLRDSMDCSPPGYAVHGIFQARVLEWGAITFSEQTANDYITST